MNADSGDALAAQVASHLLTAEGTDWGIAIEEVRIGYARIRMQVRKDMTNGHGSAHGGMIFALADTAFAYACNSRNQSTVAASASIVFLAPGHLGATLIAEAQEVGTAGRSGAYSVLVRTSDDIIIAQFQGQSRTIGGPVIDIQTQELRNG